MRTPVLGAVLAVILWADDAIAQSAVTFHAPPHTPPVFPLSRVGAAVAALGPDGVVVAGSPGVYVFGVTDGDLRLSLPLGPSVGPALAVAGGNLAFGRPGLPGFGYARLHDAVSGALLWTLVAPPEADRGDLGVAAAAYGSDFLVGETNYGLSARVPRVHLFETATGTVLRSYSNPDGEPAAAFGLSIAVVGPTVFVGALGTSKVYAFDVESGAHSLTLSSPAGAGSAFGTSVARSAGNLVVGAPDAPPLGEAYLFDGATGALLRTFLPPPEATGKFGLRVAGLGDDVLVSADSALGGVVFLLDGADGEVLRTLHNPRPNGIANAGESRFGAALATLGDGVLVGAPHDSLAGDPSSGSAHLFCGGAAGCGPCETCGPLGSCVAAPNPSCRGPVVPQQRRRLRIRNFADDARDLVSWSGKSAFSGKPNFPLQSAELSDPLTRSDYALCVFDESVTPAQLIFQAIAPAGSDCDGDPCWTLSGVAGRVQTYRFQSASRTPDGVSDVKLRHVQPGSASLRFDARGAHLSDRPLGLPALPLPLPLRVQLQVKDGTCWDARYPRAKVNTPERFSALSD